MGKVADIPPGAQFRIARVLMWLLYSMAFEDTSPGAARIREVLGEMSGDLGSAMDLAETSAVLSGFVSVLIEKKVTTVHDARQALRLIVNSDELWTVLHQLSQPTGQG